MSEPDDTSDKITAAQDALSAAFMELRETDPASFSTGMCASVYPNGSCGMALSGSKMYVRNLRNDRPVNATVRKMTQLFGGSTSTQDSVVNLPAGGISYLGCTRDEGATGNSYYYSLVGCQVL